uniref:TIL domain-containing protein n=1 Tax=Panagrolaimus sp. JU765 TaxID=591449 RepID=A0AC34RAQ4_9BILA
MKFSLFVILLMIFVIISSTEAGERRRRFQRHQRRKDYRKIRSSADCGPHEKFTICGPEPHCEISCDNLFSPPRCQGDYTNPRCYYPRCICEEGYVRDNDGRRCIAEWRCKIENHHRHGDNSRHVASAAAQKHISSNSIKANPFLRKVHKSKSENFW